LTERKINIFSKKKTHDLRYFEIRHKTKHGAYYFPTCNLRIFLFVLGVARIRSEQAGAEISGFIGDVQSWLR